MTDPRIQQMKDGNWDPGALDVADRRRIGIRILKWLVERNV
jgi:hypothetical protein